LFQDGIEFYLYSPGWLKLVLFSIKERIEYRVYDLTGDHFQRRWYGAFSLVDGGEEEMKVIQKENRRYPVW
jgi:hypothetical protein